MRIRVLAACVVSLGLGACSVLPGSPGRPEGQGRGPAAEVFIATDPIRLAKCTVDIVIDDGMDIIVTQEPVHTRSAACTDFDNIVFVRFRLPPPVAGTVYSFPTTGGVEFNKAPVPQNLIGCVRITDQYIRCTFNGRTKITHGYTVNLLKNDQPMPPLDPHMVND